MHVNSEKMHFYWLLFATIAIVHTPTSAQYLCQKKYDPAIYVGNTRIPPNCQPEQLDCPERTGSDWKAGIPQGQSSTLPLIDVNFVQCHEEFLCCGYVPINSSTGQVLGQSGVTVGSGVDLGTKTSDMLISIGVPRTIAHKLDPYYGLKANEAACAAIERPLTLSCSEAESLTEKVQNDGVMITQVQQRYDQEKAPNSTLFDDLPRGVRTAIVDIWFQFGPPEAYSTFWGYVKSNDWGNAIAELRDFYGPEANPSNGDRRRRNDDADILEAALARCNRSADIVFLLDESGSIDSSDFQSSLNFTGAIIGAFPDEILSRNRGTRFGLSLFAGSYRSIFYLTHYTSKIGYDAALNTVIQNNGSTKLGKALSLINQDQFVEERVRPKSYGFPKILIVLTDGKSMDNVTGPAARVRGNNTVIYAIGIGGYEREQLEAVASTSNHVKILSDFSDLSDLSATLIASTCYEPQPVSIGITIVSTVKEQSLQYYTFDVEVDSNLRVTVVDMRGSTFIYASRETPHPYEFNNDLGFTSAFQTNKTIVVSPTIHSTERQNSISSTIRYPIYVSIAGASDGETTYALVSSTCDPTLCSEGTNEFDDETNEIDDELDDNSGTGVPIIIISLGAMMLVSVTAAAIV